MSSGVGGTGRDAAERRPSPRWLAGEARPVRLLLAGMARRKRLDADVLATTLKRCLSTVDMTLLGIGHMVGGGIYVLTGSAVRKMSGPAVVVSFLLAGVVSFLASLCYAEFGSLVPKAGSSYVYAYVTMGELWAFLVGWNIVLEHVIGCAGVARAFSGYVDVLAQGVIKETFSFRPEGVLAGWLPGDLDFFALLFCLAVTGVQMLGVKESSRVNSVLTCVSLLVVAFIVFAGLSFADVRNLTEPDGFAPYGWSGVLAGTATCFYAFVGFDSIATSSEEAIDPARSVPLATLLSMGIVTAIYGLASLALVMMVPYWQVDEESSFASAFAAKGLHWAKYVVAVGALSSMCTSMSGGIFALLRCIYSIASDGLLFSPLARIHTATQLPLLAAALGGAAIALMALLLDITTLVEFMSIGTLMAYAIVSAAVVVLRYQDLLGNGGAPDHSRKEAEDSPILPVETGTLRVSWGVLRPLVRFPPGRVVLVCISVFAVGGVLLAVAVKHFSATLWGVAAVVLLSALLFSCGLLIGLHRQSRKGPSLGFRVPFVPLLPLASVLVNVTLMVFLNILTWVRFAIWIVIGMVIYMTYGIRHSRADADAQEGQDASGAQDAPGKEAPARLQE